MIKPSKPTVSPAHTVQAARQQDPLVATEPGRMLASAIHTMHQRREHAGRGCAPRKGAEDQ